MASSVGSVRSIRRILDGLVDEIAQITKRASKTTGAELHTVGRVEIDGRYEIDEKGELVITGSAKGVTGSTPISVGADVSRSTSSTGHGDGTIKIFLEVQVSVNDSRPDSETLKTMVGSTAQ